MYEVYKVGYTAIIVAGDFGNDGKKSGLANKCYNILKNDSRIESVLLFNGGDYDEIQNILNLISKKHYDFVFWWPNIDNSFVKNRSVKDYDPFTMLITSKRDDVDKYSFQELLQRTISVKANLSFKFKRTNTGLFNITIFDPLGSVWYDGIDIELAMQTCIDRLIFLKSMTRQNTTQSVTDKGLVLSWYFDQFKQNEYKSDRVIDVPDENNFVDTVKRYATKFQEFMPTDCVTTRFVGNASIRKLPPQVGRCGKGMPSFRRNGYIFVSKRNIDKRFITLENFVPVYMDNDKLMYCGTDKPSVDTPVQMLLYNKYSNINYILHSHCYIKNAPFTKLAIPCGAIEEAGEVESILTDTTKKFYTVNLIGHGSIVMWNNMSDFHSIYEKNLIYYKRTLPEVMF